VLDWRTLSAPIRLIYTIPAGWFATAQTALVVQDVDLRGDLSDPGENRDLDSQGVLVDLAAGYRLPRRRGIIALEVANLFDQNLAFRDDKFRTSRGEFAVPNLRFVPSRTFLASLTLNF
jgi:hypothetical protein